MKTLVLATALGAVMLFAAAAVQAHATPFAGPAAVLHAIR